MDILKIESLNKSFGKHKILKDLSLSVPEHSVFGFLGKNGAGKTTTMNMIVGLSRPTSGNISVCGEPVNYGQTKTNRFIGYLPDIPSFYNYMTPKEYLNLCGNITGMLSDEIRKKSEDLLILVGLNGINKRIGSFSRGMKQRLGIAQALLNSPKLLICDEPTSALDPIGRREILDILESVKDQTTVLFSTHILSDAEQICDRIAVLHDGKIALSGTLSEVKAQHKRESLLIEFNSYEIMNIFMASEQMKPFLKDSEKMERGLILKAQDFDRMQSIIIGVLAEEKLLPTRLEVLEPTLENLFVEVIG